MSRTQTSPQPQTEYAPQHQPQDPDFARLISKNARIGGMFKQLSAREDKIESLLPDFMKGQAKRLIARALMTFNNKIKDLSACTDEDFCRCVIEAAELGFAIDGKLAYVVKYKSDFNLQLDYKAVIAVAKRNRTIIDVDADVVCANDTFRHGKRGGESILEHTYDLSQPRGEVIGAYCRVFLPGGQWNYSVMSRTDLDKIQKMSKATFDGRPWQTWEGEMQKKSVIRRTLKLYQDDPGLMRMLEITSWEDDDAEDTPQKPTSVSELASYVNGAFSGNGNAARPQPMAPGEIPLDTPDEPTEPDAGERPQQSTSFESEAEAMFQDANSMSDVEAMRVSLAKRATSDAEKSMLMTKAEQRVAQIKSEKAKKG
jgi:phage RecT family recombinase